MEVARKLGVEPVELKSQVEAFGVAFVAAKTPKQNVLDALEQFRTALLECRKVCNRAANGAGGPYEAEQMELCLLLMGQGVDELTKTVQTEL